MTPSPSIESDTFLDRQEIAVIGYGAMGKAIVCGLLRSRGSKDLFSVLIHDIFPVPSNQLPITVRWEPDPVEAISCSSIVVLCLKPKVIGQFVKEHAQALTKKHVISIAAGVSRQELSSFVPGIVRVMPSIACQINKCTTVVLSQSSKPVSVNMAKELFSLLGHIQVIEDESLMDVVTVLSASGPAFVSLLIEAMVDGGVASGLNRSLAQTLVTQCFAGTCALLNDKESNFTTPAELRRDVCTPGGCSIAGILKMEEGAVRHWLATALRASVEKLKQSM